MVRKQPVALRETRIRGGQTFFEIPSRMTCHSLSQNTAVELEICAMLMSTAKKKVEEVIFHVRYTEFGVSHSTNSV